MQSPSPSPCIQVALVEDDVFFLGAFAAAVNAAPDMLFAGASTTVADAMLSLNGPPVDVLLVDLGLPDGSGIEVIREAHARWPACAIMVSTTFADEMHVIQSIEAGATGYLLKDSTPEHIASEIRNLKAGGSPISPLIARQILMRFRQTVSQPASNAPHNSPASLSTRELEVLQLITKGFTYDEIARLINVSRNTVLTFVRRIYSKLEVKSKTEAIHEARSQGLLRA
jgi:DNA-binding NarL/FixJ family response regulator